MENQAYKNKEEFKACLSKFRRQFVFGIIVLFFAHYIFFYMLNVYGTSDKKDSQIALFTHKAKTWEGYAKQLETTYKALIKERNEKQKEEIACKKTIFELQNKLQEAKK